MDELRNDENIPTKEEKQELDKVEQVIKQSRKLSPKIKKAILNIKEKKRNYDALTSRLEEMLDSYLVIGFDNNGNDYIVVKAPTPQDNLALNALIDRFVDGHFTSITSQDFNNKFDDDDNDD